MDRAYPQPHSHSHPHPPFASSSRHPYPSQSPHPPPPPPHSSTAPNYPHHPPPPHLSHHSYPPAHRDHPASPRGLPTLTLQRPSNPHALPPLEFIRPGSVSDPHIPLGSSRDDSYRHKHHPSLPHHPASYPSRRASFEQHSHNSAHHHRHAPASGQSHRSPVHHVPQHSRHRTEHRSNSPPPPFAFPPPPPRVAAPATTRHTPPSTASNDLSRYAIASDGDSRSPRDSGYRPNPSRSPSHYSPKSASDPSRHTSIPYIKEEPGLRQSAKLSPIAFESDRLSRKRKSHYSDYDYDELVAMSPETSMSTNSIGSPAFDGSLPPFKRRTSTAVDRDVKPGVNSPPTFPANSNAHYANWQGQGDREGGSRTDARRILHHLPIPPQPPLTVFPVQYNWPPAAGGEAPAAGREGHIDQALSSVRSSAGTGNGAAPATVNDVLVAPELRLPETLGSAGAAASGNGMDGVDGDADDDHLLGEDPDSLAPPEKKEGAFSRSPELRVSHKLAERKRRKEMKDLFDELREQLPADRGLKASKWEILSKAVDYIAHLKTENQNLTRTVDMLHRDLSIARGEDPNAPPSWASMSAFANLLGGNRTYPSSTATAAAAPAAAAPPAPASIAAVVNNAAVPATTTGNGVPAAAPAAPSAVPAPSATSVDAKP